MFVFSVEGDLDGEPTPPRKSPDLATEFKKELKVYQNVLIMKEEALKQLSQI